MAQIEPVDRDELLVTAGTFDALYRDLEASAVKTRVLLDKISGVYNTEAWDAYNSRMAEMESVLRNYMEFAGHMSDVFRMMHEELTVAEVYAAPKLITDRRF